MRGLNKEELGFVCGAGGSGRRGNSCRTLRRQIPQVEFQEIQVQEVEVEEALAVAPLLLASRRVEASPRPDWRPPRPPELPKKVKIVSM